MSYTKLGLEALDEVAMQIRGCAVETKLFLCFLSFIYLLLPKLFKTSFFVLTRLAFASILGPFGVHLLKFTLDTYPGSLMHYLGGLLKCPVRIRDALHITTHTRRI